ncbi:hypothetical protein RCG23_16110 [Neobacillus sp. PS3-34]|uniref:hypothetical protein n=1 Tax=Neobacillus sp. PS3-34 TaxID=3070678 RepID=UPI0027DF4D56|nr:hypothetical protein [Neobacillus sp. PS3-34]WML47099.1 hypothetical protein RCG23_16110 [Neobacillus sp. PS3-34]
MSESVVYSDRFNQIKGYRVRISGLFGQVQSNQRLSCPYQWSIWTSSIKSKAIVSESVVYSDKFNQIKGYRVRISGLFGQVQSNQRQSCPNQWSIRTGLIKSKAIVS